MGLTYGERRNGHSQRMSQACEQERLELHELLQQEPCDSAKHLRDRITALIAALEQTQPVDLSTPEALQQQEDVA